MTLVTFASAGRRGVALALAVLLAALAIQTASAAPQAYLIRGTWDTTGVPIGAAKGNIFESIWIYDPTPYDSKTNPTGALDVTSIEDLGFPGYESHYRIPSPSIGMPDIIPNAGPGGTNYLDVNLADPNNVDFPRSKVNNSNEPVDPALIKVWNDVPDYGGLDGIQLVDHLDLNPIGLGPVKRWDLFVLNFGLFSSTALPSDLEFDTLGAPWGFGIEANGGYVAASSFDQIPLGDASRDGTVDGADYTVWADNYLDTFTWGALWKDGDFNIDGVVDGGDYTVWADHYLETMPLSAAALAMAVPEPGTFGLAAIGGALVLASAIRRRRRHL